MVIERVSVSAASNIALIKYWGKRAGGINEPATASLSIGLEDLRTETTVERNAQGSHVVDGLDEKAAGRLTAFLDALRADLGIDDFFKVSTSNNFPTGAGLASSASGFAAVVLGINRLCGLGLDERQLTQFARRGSGSAARSIHGGYMQVVLSDEPGGSYAEPLLEAAAWPLDVIVAVISETGKPVGSTEAMNRAAGTSPYYDAWVQSHPADMQQAREAIAGRDFAALADVAEHNCLKMHGTMLTSRPAVSYWLPGTMAVMQTVRALRGDGIPAFFTIDAGSQVKVICEPASTDQVAAAIASTRGVLRTIRTRVGGNPVIRDE